MKTFSWRLGLIIISVFNFRKKLEASSVWCNLKKSYANFIFRKKKFHHLARNFIVLCDNTFIRFQYYFCITKCFVYFAKFCKNVKGLVSSLVAVNNNLQTGLRCSHLPIDNYVAAGSGTLTPTPPPQASPSRWLKWLKPPLPAWTLLCNFVPLEQDLQKAGIKISTPEGEKTL